MPPPRTWTVAQLAEAIHQSTTWKETSAALGVRVCSNALRRVADDVGLDYAHFPGHRTLRGRAARRITDEALFVDGPVRSQKLVKTRFLKYVELKCATCGLTEWLGKPAPLQLDH